MGHMILCFANLVASYIETCIEIDDVRLTPHLEAVASYIEACIEILLRFRTWRGQHVASYIEACIEINI